MLKKLCCLLAAASLPFILAGCNEKGAKPKDAAGAKTGIEYYKKGDLKKALPLLRKEAAAGSAEATYFLGIMHRDGRGAEKDPKKSCTFLLAAAEGRISEAYLPAAACYREKSGFPENPAEAFKWAKKAAPDEGRMDEKSAKLLASIMGEAYFTGEGTSPDNAKAVQWYEKSAEHGDAHAQGVLAYLYYFGKGILIDRERAALWAARAASVPNEMKDFASGILHLAGTPKNVKKALASFEKSARNGNPLAHAALAEIYEKGRIVKKNLQTAYRHYKLAAKGGGEAMKKSLADFEDKYHFSKND